MACLVYIYIYIYYTLQGFAWCLKKVATYVMCIYIVRGVKQQIFTVLWYAEYTSRRAVISFDQVLYV